MTRQKNYLWMEDCSFSIRINGHELLMQEGMFFPVKIGLDQYLEEQPDQNSSYLFLYRSLV